MALAPLGFTVDTSGVAKAVADLSNMTAATGKAETAARELSVNVNLAVNVINKITAATTQAAAANDNMTAAINKQAAAIGRLTAAERVNTASHYADRAADIAAYGMEMDRLRAKFEPLFAAQQRYAAALEEINRANQVGAISAATAIQARLRETAAYQAQISVLNNLAAAQKAAAQQMVDRVTITPDRAADIAAYGAELDRLRTRFSPIFAASKAYEAELNDLNRAHRIGAISAAEHGAALAALNGRYQMAAGGAQTMGASTAMAQQSMRNLAFQFQDIGTMLAMGQNPFMLLAQQLPQVTMYGGQLTGVMGALKQTLAGLFSPLGLLTTGFVLAGSAAVSYFMDAGEEADIAAEALEEQADLIQRVADKWGDAIPALREYAAAMDDARDAAELQQASQIIQNSYLDQLRTLLPQLNAELSRFGAAAASGGWGSALERDATAVADAFDEVFDALQAAAQAVAEGEDATDELRAANEALSNLLNSDAIPAVGGMTEAVNALSSAYAIATAAAQELNRQQAIAAAQEANRGRMDKTGQRLGQGANPLSPNEFMSRFGWEAVIDFPRERTARRAGRTRKTDAERAAERYDDMLRKAEQFIAAQRLERDALFMTEEAANALRYEQELLNQAANDNIALTPAMAAELKNYAQAMAATEAETVRLQEALDFARDLTGGFFDDFRRGLEQGKGFWESFGNAALNALDKITDKLLNDVLDALFQVNKAGSGTGGGGGIFGFLGSLLGGGGGRLTNLPLGIGLYSQGGYTGPGGVNDVAGLVHKGEVVWSQDDIRRAGGVTSVEAMRRGAMPRMQASANGNGVGGTSVLQVRLSPELIGQILSEAEGQSVRISQGAISEYDQTMPERIGGQMNQARRIGAI